LVVRKLAGIALAASVLVSVAGCSFNPSPESLQSYAPSDGVGATLNFGSMSDQSVVASNVLILTDGSQHVLFGTIDNAGSKSETVTLRDANNSGAAYTFTLPAGAEVKFDATNKLDLPFSGNAGDTFGLEFGPDGAGKFETLNVPVLDATIDYYKGLLSTPSPAASETPSVTPTPAN